MESGIISIVSLTISLTAASVATWQARFNVRAAERARALPVVTEAFREYRSKEFLDSVRYLITEVPSVSGAEGFRSLPEEWQYHAYRVCYLFDYMGVLTASVIVREELVISFFGSGIMRVWEAIEVYIKLEREYRVRTYSPKAPPGFLVYYEHLVGRILDRGGKDAALLIQSRSGLRHIVKPVNDAG
jgi:hypothetical protein